MTAVEIPAGATVIETIGSVYYLDDDHGRFLRLPVAGRATPLRDPEWERMDGWEIVESSQLVKLVIALDGDLTRTAVIGPAGDHTEREEDARDG